MNQLPFEKLDVYRVATELLEFVARLGTIRGHADLHDQLTRAATSVVLNCAEACGKDGADRRRYFVIARGSALESAAALKVLCALGALAEEDHAAGREYCVRLYAMLTRLSGKSTPASER